LFLKINQQCCVTCLFYYFISPDAVFHNSVKKKMAKVKSNDDSRAKHNAISGRLSDYFGFKLSENGSVLSVENVYLLYDLS